MARISPGKTGWRKFGVYLVVGWGTLAALAGAWKWWAALGIVLFATYTIVPLVAYIRWDGRWPFYPGRLFRVGVVRVALYAEILMPIMAVFALMGLAAGSAFGPATLGGQLGATGAFMVTMGLFVAGYVGSRRLVVRRVDVTLPGLPESFEGMRIVQVSDLHVGPHVPRRFLDRVRNTVESLDADLIAVTGDMVDDRAEDVHLYAAAFGRMKATHGVFVVAGNHDVYANWRLVESSLAVLTNATILVNKCRVLQRNGERLAIVGIGDPAGRRSQMASVAPDVTGAMKQVPEGVLAVVLAHNPVLWPELTAHGANLTLSGHTHWGHIAVFRWGWSAASIANEYHMGGYEKEGSLLYVAPGTGYWGVPFRLGAFPEITLVTLRREGFSSLRVERSVPV